MPEEAKRAQLARILRNASTDELVDWLDVVAEAERHGVLPLIASSAAARASAPPFRALMRSALAAQTALAIVRQRELRRVLDALHADRLPVIVFKGAHLAFTIYASPGLRPYVDTDILVKRDDRARLDRALVALGYEAVPQATGEVAFGQQQYWRADKSGAGHTIDLHWRVANPQAFANRLTFADLAEGARPVPAFGLHAFGPCGWMALLIACLHRTAHHGTSHRLIWLYDIHLLASGLSARDWEELVSLARRRALSGVLAVGLGDAYRCFGAGAPEDVLERLRAESSADEDVAAFLSGPRSRLDVAASDWRHIRRWRDRARFAREHLFPSASYMAHRYGTASPFILPLLYIRRIVAGTGTWAAERWRLTGH